MSVKKKMAKVYKGPALQEKIMCQEKEQPCKEDGEGRGEK